MTLKLTAAFSENPRVEPLKNGTVKAQNIELSFVALEPGALFLRNLFYNELDLSEMSISEALLALERSDGTKWELSHAGALGLDQAGPAGVEHHFLGADQTLDRMLDRGESDACTAIRPHSRGSTTLPG